MKKLIQKSNYKYSYRSEIDGLRAFSILSVVIYHAFPSWLKGGFIGVDVFFVISGFLITSHIFENLDKGRFSFIDFFGRRIRRILPSLILVMSFSLVFGWYTLVEDELAQLGKHVASSAAFIANFTLANEIGYFDNAAKSKPMLHLWSLAVEGQFYIVLPLVLWLAFKQNFNLLRIVLLMALISFLLNLLFGKSHPNENFFWPWGRFWELLSGSILAWFFLYKSNFSSKLKSYIKKNFLKIIHYKSFTTDVSVVSNVTSFFGLLLLVYGVFRINEASFDYSKWALVPILGALLIISSGSKAWLNRIFFMNPIAVWFGLISYPLYLWHWPILSFLYIVHGSALNIDTRILAIIISILLAWLTYRFVEKPIRFNNRKEFKSFVLIIIIVVIGSIGIYIKLNGGKTPYNSSLNYIAKAKGDWDYPKGLQKGDINQVWYTSKKSAEVIFLGDSKVEQHSPRIYDLYQKGVSKEVAFITKNGCLPVYNVYHNKNKHCLVLMENFEKVTFKNNVDTIIIGAAFNKYFVRNEYESKEEWKLVKNSFYDLISKLSKKYKVVVLLDNPSDIRFDPNYLLSLKNGRRPIPLIPLDTNIISFSQQDYQIQIANEMKEKLSDLNIDFLDQVNLICPNGVCLSVNDKGLPIYKDALHIRPYFVKEHMNILDFYILRSN